ncbi:Aste57867_13454 [Aphanomyces stellatus]|uniref:Aste57867_13454 protein n=1 Tax=Aphanomyces stellatus TaxID=120398 RepID=A0A485KY49_9STRA|nr:hypothetical protein As57867_013404 [Aphanomyces stellatus]VFT90292.1 Aste57867_13454 [Aphanomyces stellatus]
MALQSNGASTSTTPAPPVAEPSAAEPPVAQKDEYEPGCLMKCFMYLSMAILGLVLLGVLLASGVVYIVAAIVNFVFWIVVIVIGTPFQLRKWLGWKHECASFRLLVAMKFRDAEFYRAHVKQLDKLREATEKRSVDTIVQALVQAQVDAVSTLLDGATTFIQVKDTMTLSSVVVATIFYVAYLIYFAHHAYDIAAVNSKVHDALAIILPFLLQEELAVAMAQVLLWCKWTTANFKGSEFGSKVYQFYTIVTCTCFTKEGRQIEKLKFDNSVSQQCFGVGIGASDTTGVATFVTALWTLLFLIQGYIVETLADDDVGDAAWMQPMYWVLVVYSGVLVAFCYLPFFTKSSDQQKEDFESVAASCEAYLLLQHMSRLQELVEVELPEKTSPIVRAIRLQALRLMDTEDIVSYSLYVLALSTYNFFSGAVEKPSLADSVKASSNVDNQASRPVTLQPIIPAESHYWGARKLSIWEAGHIDDAFPTFLLPMSNVRHDTMTLFTVPVMGIRSFQDVLTERKITDMDVLYDNPLVQEKKVYVARETKDMVCIGLEVKVMEHYTTSIYIVAEKGTQFGRGHIYVEAHSLRSVVKTPGKEFVQVVDDDQLRVLAACTLDIDPTKLETQSIKTIEA